MTKLENLILGQLEYYAERVAFFLEQGDEFMADLFQDKAQELLQVEECDEIMILTDHRLMSADGGNTFLVTHGDPEFL